jgi:hypothetical protein
LYLNDSISEFDVIPTVAVMEGRHQGCGCQVSSENPFTDASVVKEGEERQDIL